MPQLLVQLNPLLREDAEMRENVGKLDELLSHAKLTWLVGSIIRHVFLIELVKVPKIETTKVRARWYDQLNGDPRHCSYEECLAIARDLVDELANGWLENAEQLQELDLFYEHPVLSYEVPIDYAAVDTERIHRQGNLIWAADPLTVRTLRLRSYLTDAEAHDHAEFFKRAIEAKIKVKTYLTDRALTGLHKTNREKRWEAHPSSVQFGTRRTCLSIEFALLVQLCGFEGFPEDLRTALQEQGVLPADVATYRCPVTQEPMSYVAFREEILNPQIGRSKFQVGHLNPLKLSPEEDVPEGYGHTADNIGWISSDGNRIQGHLSLADTRVLLRKIAQNYEERGWV